MQWSSDDKNSECISPSPIDVEAKAETLSFLEQGNHHNFGRNEPASIILLQRNIAEQVVQISPVMSSFFPLFVGTNNNQRCQYLISQLAFGLAFLVFLFIGFKFLEKEPSFSQSFSPARSAAAQLHNGIVFSKMSTAHQFLHAVKNILTKKFG